MNEKTFYTERVEHYRSLGNDYGLSCENAQSEVDARTCVVTSEFDCASRDCELHYTDAPIKLAHVDYPHFPGALYDCQACEAECFCSPQQDCVHCAIKAEGVPASFTVTHN